MLISQRFSAYYHSFKGFCVVPHFEFRTYFSCGFYLP